MTIGLFAPLPLAIMIPFMAGQSFAMGEAFGKGFQYGKRRVSAMTNEEFNAMSAKDHFDETTADISAMIPTMKKQMGEFTLLQSDIIKELIAYVRQLPADIIGGLTGGASTPEIETTPSGETNITIPGGQRPGLTSGTSSWFLLGIDAILNLWAFEGAISFESLAKFREQYTSAIQTAQKNSDLNRLRDIRDAMLRDEAKERFENRQVVPVVEPFTPLTTSQAAAALIRDLKEDLLNLNQRINIAQSSWRNAQDTIAKYKSEMRAILDFTKNNPNPTMTQRYYFLQSQLPLLEKQKQDALVEQKLVNDLIRKTQDFIAEAQIKL